MAGIAQLVEPRIVIPVVAGSNPVSRPIMLVFIFLGLHFIKKNDNQLLFDTLTTNSYDLSKLYKSYKRLTIIVKNN